MIIFYGYFPYHTFSWSIWSSFFSGWPAVLEWVAVCCSELQCVTVRCSMLQCVAVCCSVLQCGAVWCSVLQCVAVSCFRKYFSISFFVFLIFHILFCLHFFYFPFFFVGWSAVFKVRHSTCTPRRAWRRNFGHFPYRNSSVRVPRFGASHAGA